MKTKYLKRFMYGFVPLATVGALVPALTISHKTKQVQVMANDSMAMPIRPVVGSTNNDFNAFLHKVNDHSTDSAMNNLLNIDVNSNMLRSSHFYISGKTSTKESTQFAASSIEVLIAKLEELAKSKEAGFTDDLKVAIGKWMVANYAFTNFIADKGFSNAIDVTQNEIENPGVTNIVDPLDKKMVNNKETPIEFKLDGKPISLQGKTGFNADWSKNLGNDNVYDISNQDILNYYIGAIANSQDYVKMLKNLKANQAAHQNNVSDMNFHNLMSLYFADSTNVLADVTTSAMNIDQITKINHMNLLKGIDVSAISNDDALYETLMNSGFGEALYGSEFVTKIHEFEGFGEEDKKYEINDFIRRLANKLTDLQQVNSANFLNIISNSTIANKPLDDAGAAQSVLQFATILMDKSNNLTSDVQIRVVSDDLKNGGSIYYRTGHGFSDWSEFANNQITLNYVVPGDSLANSSIDYAQYVFHGLKYVDLPKTIYSMSKSVQLADDKNAIVAVHDKSNQVWWTGHSSSGYIKLSLTSNNVEHSLSGQTEDLIVDEYGNDSAIKNKTAWTTTALSSTGVQIVDSDSIVLNNATLYFYWMNNEINNKRTFDKLVDSIKSAIPIVIESANDVVTSWKNSKNPNSQYDPTKPVHFNIYLSRIKFEQIRYNTSNDTWLRDTNAFNFRFNKVNADFNIEIQQ